MDIEKIEKFIDAGYTKAEIEAMEKAAGSGDNAGKSAGTPDDTAEKEQSHASAEDASPLSAEVTKAIEALTNTVTGLQQTVKAMQDSNIDKSHTDKPDKGGVDEVIKSFIDTL